MQGTGMYIYHIQCICGMYIDVIHSLICVYIKMMCSYMPYMCVCSHVQHLYIYVVLFGFVYINVNINRKFLKASIEHIRHYQQTENFQARMKASVIVLKAKLPKIDLLLSLPSCLGHTFQLHTEEFSLASLSRSRIYQESILQPTGSLLGLRSLYTVRSNAQPTSFLRDSATFAVPSSTTITHKEPSRASPTFIRWSSWVQPPPRSAYC